MRIFALGMSTTYSRTILKPGKWWRWGRSATCKSSQVCSVRLKSLWNTSWLLLWAPSISCLGKRISLLLCCCRCVITKRLKTHTCEQIQTERMEMLWANAKVCFQTELVPHICKMRSHDRQKIGHLHSVYATRTRFQVSSCALRYVLLSCGLREYQQDPVVWGNTNKILWSEGIPTRSCGLKEYLGLLQRSAT